MKQAETGAFREPAQALDADKFGMWVFIGSEALFFGALILAYLIARKVHAPAFVAGSKELSFWLGTINTAVLLTSSLTMALAERRTEEADWRSALNLMRATALLGIVFLAIKFYEYSEEIAKGLAPLLGVPFLWNAPDQHGGMLFFDFYFALTGLHALHLAAGIAVIAAVALAWTSTNPERRLRRATVMALYWHFVDIVWVFVYPLLYLINR